MRLALKAVTRNDGNFVDVILLYISAALEWVLILFRMMGVPKSNTGSETGDCD